jgi:hypothetical protein
MGKVEKVGHWVRMQRAQRRAKTLVSEEERRLDDVGFIWNPLDEFWDVMIRALTQF